jgi:hypothetical protein
MRILMRMTNQMTQPNSTEPPQTKEQQINDALFWLLHDHIRTNWDSMRGAKKVEGRVHALFKLIHGKKATTEDLARILYR